MRKLCFVLATLTAFSSAHAAVKSTGFAPIFGFMALLVFAMWAYLLYLKFKNP